MKRCLNCMEEYAENRVRCPGCDYCEGENGTNPDALKVGSILQSRYIVGTHRMIREYDITYIGWDALFERKVLILEFCWQDHLKGGKETTPLMDSVMYDVYSDSLNQFYHYYRNLIHLYNEKDMISVLSCFRENQTAYAIFEYVAGVTLAEWLRDSTDTDGTEAVYLLYRAIEAVKKIHTLGLVHGDLRLDSFFVTGTRELVLKQFAQPNVCHGEFKQWENPEPGPWIDVYGLSMLFGKILLRREDVSRRDVLKILDSDEFEFPARIVSAIEKGINITGEQRIESLDDFFGRIFGDSATMRLLKHSHVEPHNQRRKVRRLFYAGIVAAFCLLLVLVVALGGNSKEQIVATSSITEVENQERNVTMTVQESAETETTNVEEESTKAETIAETTATAPAEATAPEETAESSKPSEITASTEAATQMQTPIGPGAANAEVEGTSEISPPQSNSDGSTLGAGPRVTDEDTVLLEAPGAKD